MNEIQIVQQQVRRHKPFAGAVEQIVAEDYRAEALKIHLLCLKERLRYKWWYGSGARCSSFMQPLGDFGRKYFAYLQAFRAFSR